MAGPTLRVVCEACEQGVPNGTPGRGCIYCDEWEQARHGGDLMRAVDAGRLQREDVTQLGDVLAGTDQFPSISEHRRCASFSTRC